MNFFDFLTKGSDQSLITKAKSKIALLWTCQSSQGQSNIFLMISFEYFLNSHFSFTFQVGWGGGWLLRNVFTLCNRSSLHLPAETSRILHLYATQPMIDKPLDQLRYKKPIEDSLITYGQACSKNDVPHRLSEIAL